MIELPPEREADPERMLVLRYAPARARAGLAALLALDDRLGAILRSTREPMVGQIRLAWWREALVALDSAPPPPEPVLRAIADQAMPCGVTGMMLAGMIDGWEILLDQASLPEAMLRSFATGRGGRLFTACAAVLDAHDAGIAPAGEGWALADLVRHLTDREVASRAAVMARPRLATSMTDRWSRNARPLGAMALLARADLAGTPPGSPRRAGRLLWHRLTGR